jgi:hypothetical protein
MSESGAGLEFVGRWRITWTEIWDSDALDLVSPAYIQFGDDGLGGFGMIALRGWLDCRYGQRDGRPSVGFRGKARMKATTHADGVGLYRSLMVHCVGGSSSIAQTTRSFERPRQRLGRPQKGLGRVGDQRCGSSSSTWICGVDCTRSTMSAR